MTAATTSVDVTFYDKTMDRSVRLKIEAGETRGQIWEVYPRKYRRPHQGGSSESFPLIVNVKVDELRAEYRKLSANKAYEIK